MRRLTIYNFLKRNKYKIVAGPLVGALIVTSGMAISGCSNGEISYDDKGITKKVVTSATVKPFATYEKETVEAKATEEVEAKIETTVAPTTEVVIATTESLKETKDITVETETTVYTTAPTQESHTEATKATKASTNDVQNNYDNDGYYIDSDGNLWNSYEEYKQFNDVIEEEANTYTYTR